MKYFFLNYAQKVVVLKSKGGINLKTIKGTDFISKMAEICLGLVGRQFPSGVGNTEIWGQTIWFG
jgi:hypothetical protein